MSSTNDSTTLTGHEAIDYADAHGLTLSKYADPTEDAREGLSVDEAREVAKEDPALIYMEVQADEQSPNGDMRLATTIAGQPVYAMTASRFADKTAAEALEALCPGGEPVDGVEVDQDWDNECTVLTFEDGTALRVDDVVREVD